MFTSRARFWYDVI